jgi:uncharacterized protein YcbK (DUF882 family)
LRSFGTFVETDHQPGINRRHFIKMGLLSTIAAAVNPIQVVEAITRSLPPTRSLSLYNTHTNESLAVSYCRSGNYCSKGLARINQIMRDHRTGDIKAIDTRLLDILYALAHRLDHTVSFHIISGYRSQATNASLRRKSRGVARRSYHTQGMAIDIRTPSLQISMLHTEALNLNAGGVGYYPESDFIHIDCGPTRNW